MITDSQIQEYSEKGAILLKKAFNIEWLSLLAKGIEKNRKNPGPYACQYTPADKEGDFYDDYCNWQRLMSIEISYLNHLQQKLLGV